MNMQMNMPGVNMPMSNATAPMAVTADQKLFVTTWLNYKEPGPQHVPLVSKASPAASPHDNVVTTKYNQADLQLAVHSSLGDSTKLGARRYIYQVDTDAADFSVHVQDWDKMGMDEMMAMHVHRNRMLKKVGELAPVCTESSGSCMADYHQIRVNCVEDGHYNMRLTVQDMEDGSTYQMPFHLECSLKPFPSRGDIGHLAPAVPGLLYLTFCLIVWAWSLRKRQIRSSRFGHDAAVYYEQHGLYPGDQPANAPNQPTAQQLEPVKANAIRSWMNNPDAEVYLWMLIGLGIGLAHAAILIGEDEFFTDPTNGMHTLVGFWMIAGGLLHILAKRSQRLQPDNQTYSPFYNVILPSCFAIMAILFTMHGQAGALDYSIHHMFSLCSAVWAVLYILAATRQTNVPFMMLYHAIGITMTMSFCCACEWMLTHNRWKWSSVNYCFVIALAGVTYTAVIFLLTTFAATISTSLELAPHSEPMPAGFFKRMWYILRHTSSAMFNNNFGQAYAPLTATKVDAEADDQLEMADAYNSSRQPTNGNKAVYTI